MAAIGGISGLPFPGGQSRANQQSPTAQGLDPEFNQTISQALNAAFGANPQTRQVMPGPISHLTQSLRGDLQRGGYAGIANAFPNPAGSVGNLPTAVTPSLQQGTLFPKTQGFNALQPSGQAFPNPSFSRNLDGPMEENNAMAALSNLAGMISLLFSSLFQNSPRN